MNSFIGRIAGLRELEERYHSAGLQNYIDNHWMHGQMFLILCEEEFKMKHMVKAGIDCLSRDYWLYLYKI